MYEIIQGIKRYQKNRLALRLQGIEADLVIGEVVSRIREAGIPCLTVHDSVMCKYQDRGFVYSVMKDKLQKLIGHECELKVTRHDAP